MACACGPRATRRAPWCSSWRSRSRSRSPSSRAAAPPSWQSTRTCGAPLAGLLVAALPLLLPLLPLQACLPAPLCSQALSMRSPRCPHCRPCPPRSIIGVKDAIALGDASLFAPDRLPATAQVAGQQGAYAAHLINRGFSLGVGGMDQVRPRLVAALHADILPAWFCLSAVRLVIGLGGRPKSAAANPSLSLCSTSRSPSSPAAAALQGHQGADAHRPPAPVAGPDDCGGAAGRRRQGARLLQQGL